MCDSLGIASRWQLAAVATLSSWLHMAASSVGGVGVPPSLPARQSLRLPARVPLPACLQVTGLPVVGADGRVVGVISRKVSQVEAWCGACLG